MALKASTALAAARQKKKRESKLSNIYSLLALTLEAEVSVGAVCKGTCETNAIEYEEKKNAETNALKYYM